MKYPRYPSRRVEDRRKLDGYLVLFRRLELENRRGCFFQLCGESLDESTSIVLLGLPRAPQLHLLLPTMTCGGIAIEQDVRQDEPGSHATNDTITQSHSHALGRLFGPRTVLSVGENNANAPY